MEADKVRRSWQNDRGGVYQGRRWRFLARRSSALGNVAGSGVLALCDREPRRYSRQVENLREQATRCPRLAKFTTDREIARKLLELAMDFERQALELEDRNG